MGISLSLIYLSSCFFLVCFCFECVEIMGCWGLSCCKCQPLGSAVVVFGFIGFECKSFGGGVFFTSYYCVQ